MERKTIFAFVKAREGKRTNKIQNSIKVLTGDTMKFAEFLKSCFFNKIVHN